MGKWYINRFQVLRPSVRWFGPLHFRLSLETELFAGSPNPEWRQFRVVILGLGFDIVLETKSNRDASAHYEDESEPCPCGSDSSLGCSVAGCLKYLQEMGAAAASHAGPSEHNIEFPTNQNWYRDAAANEELGEFDFLAGGFSESDSDSDLFSTMDKTGPNEQPSIQDGKLDDLGQSATGGRTAEKELREAHIHKLSQLIGLQSELAEAKQAFADCWEDYQDLGRTWHEDMSELEDKLKIEQARVKRLRGVLLDYAAHRPECLKFFGTCTCGFDDACSLASEGEEK